MLMFILISDQFKSDIMTFLNTLITVIRYLLAASSSVSSAIILPYFSKSVIISLSKANGIFFLKVLYQSHLIKAVLSFLLKPARS